MPEVRIAAWSDVTAEFPRGGGGTKSGGGCLGSGMVGSDESSRRSDVESSSAEVDVNEDRCLGVGNG